MCFFKKCKYSGIGKYYGYTFANICPRNKLKNSFIRLPNIFNALTIEKPNYYELNEVKYLITSGTGVFISKKSEIKGVYTLTLADTNSRFDRFTLEFFSVDSSGCIISVLLSFKGDITISKCTCFGKKKKIDNTAEKEEDFKNPFECPYLGNYAKKVIYYPNGAIEEFDLINYNRCH